MAMPAETDHAWAAGIIDGEGCIFIARRKGGGKNGARADCYTVAIKVTMGHEPTILRLRDMFGSGSKHKVEQVGWNPAYTWLVSAKLCGPVIDAVQPYIFTKQGELILAKEFLSLPGWFGGNHRGPKSEEYQAREWELWDRMRRLKPRTAHRLRMEEEIAKDRVRP
jgi:hypothetical protein